MEIIQRQIIPEEHKLYKSFLCIIEEIKTAKLNSENIDSQHYLSQVDRNESKISKNTETLQPTLEDRIFSEIEIVPLSAEIKSNFAEADFKLIITSEYGNSVDFLKLEFVKETGVWLLKNNDYSIQFLFFLYKNYSPLPTESITTFTIHESNKTLIPIRFNSDPEIWELNKNVTWEYLERWLFANNSEIDMDYHWYGTENWPENSATFYLDPYWHRIVYSKYDSDEIKAFDIEFYPGAEYPSETWGITIDDWGGVYVVDKRNNCLVKLIYVTANSLYFSDKMDIAGLDGPTDVVFSTGLVPNAQGDDYFLIANKNARNIIKTDFNGNVLNVITRFKTGGNYYDFISPSRIAQIPGTTYIAVIDDLLNYLIVGYISGSNTLECQNVIKFQGNQHPKDVGVNCFGDIFVPDDINQIHKFTYIGVYLCTYKTDALKFPLRFSRIKDPDYYVFDQSASNRWSPTHGLKRFVPGSDAFKLAYNQGTDEHQFLYWLSDRSEVKLEIINSNNIVIKTIYYEDRASGKHTDIISLNAIPLGQYTFRVNHRPLFDEIYGSYQQGWRYTQIPISVQLKATISGPTTGTPGTTNNFTAVTNAQYATYQWEKLLPCCGDDSNCGIYFYRGNQSTLSVLNSVYHYYLRLTVWDGSNNSAWDSHFVTVQTCVAGGGGNGCPTLAFASDSLSDSGMEDENTLLIASTAHPTEDIVDYYLIQTEISPTHDEINFTIREPKTEHTWLDHVGFIEVELNEDELLAVTDNGEIVNFLQQNTTFSIMLNNSLDVSDILSSSDGDTLNLEPGDILSISVSGATNDLNNFIVTEGSVVAKNITADIMFVPVGSEEEDLGDIFLRPNVSLASVNLGSLGEGKLEIEFQQYSTLDYLTLVNDLNTADIEALRMINSVHSESGDVLELLVNDPDQRYSEIYPGQDISFTFREGEHTKPKIQYILKTVGRYEIDTTESFNKLEKNNEEVIIPKENKLFDNYPNPFNPTTQIKYSIKENGLVTLKIYDALGKEVSTLVDEEKQAGTYTVSFNASKLASGIYFYTMSMKEFQETNKMLLLK